MSQNSSAPDTSDREIVVSRIYSAPRELVFSAWTDPKHLAQWWGPDGFTNTFSEFDMREGGRWTFIMRGPDGKDWPNQITFTKVIRPERLEFIHGTGLPDDRDQFETIVTFEAKGNRTLLTMRTILQSKAARDFVVREVGAIEGGKQTLARLAGYVVERNLASSGSPILFTVKRRFNFSAERLFDAWVQPEHVRKWLFATEGGNVTRCEFDARVGGSFVLVERRGDVDAYHGGEYFEVKRPTRLVFSFGIDPELTDAGLVEIDIVPHGSACELTLRQTMHPKFAEYKEPSIKGWTKLLEKLDAELARTAEKES